ncbi:MAG: hypothetical protein VX730_08495 [Pseudomonadota bacterium]|nr:hypothetical protein [Pseudomonadota bacterium]
MAPKFPSTMLDEDGNAPTNQLAAVAAEVARLEGLVDNVEEQKKRCYPQKEGDPAVNPKNLAAVMASKLAVAESCADWLIDKVLPAVTDRRALGYVKEALLKMRGNLLVLDTELEKFCRQNDVQPEEI